MISEKALEQLSFLVSHHYVPGELTKELYGRVAVLLSERVHKETPWTWNYVHQVHRNKIEPGQRFLGALVLLYKEVVRYGATTIEITFPHDVDGKAEKERILEELTPLECYHALADKVDEKERIEEEEISEAFRGVPVNGND